MADYITASDVRSAGLADPPTDAQVTAAIPLCQQILERYCRQWFEPRPLTFKFDGNDSNTVFLGIPIISVTYLRINGQTSDLDPAKYHVYNSRAYPDDRRNPKIRLGDSTDPGSIFDGEIRGHSRLHFLKGPQNQEISGTFGFLESDDTCPLAIKEALVAMVIEKLKNPLAGASVVSTAPTQTYGGVIIEEETDGHRRKWANNVSAAPLSTRRAGLDALLTPYVKDLLSLYRAPIGVATPAGYSK